MTNNASCEPLNSGKAVIGSLGADSKGDLHVLGLPQHHETFTVVLRHNTAITLTTSLENAIIRMIENRIVIDFARIRGGRIVLDVTDAGPDAIFAAQITPSGGVPMPAFDALFHGLSTELDIPVSDVAWALAKVVQLDVDNYLSAEANSYKPVAAE